MRLSDNQMRQAFEMWVESMPHEGVGDPFRQVGVPRERLETSADGSRLCREHDITTLWDTATWAVDHLRRNLTDSTARVDALQVVNVEQQQWIIAAERELAAATSRAEKAEAALAEARRQVDALAKLCSGQVLIGTNMVASATDWIKWSANEARKGATA